MTGLADIPADPVVARSLGAALAVIFLAGAWQKFREFEEFRGNVEAYGLLPSFMLLPVTLAVPVIEGLAGLLLLSVSTRMIGLGLGVGLLAVVTTAIVINLLRGNRDIDCGCGGLFSHVGEQILGWGLVARNTVLLAGLLVSVADNTLRPMTWIDFFSVACGTLALLGLYASANQLMANHPRLTALRAI